MKARIQNKFTKPFINGFQGWLQTDEYGGYEAALKEHSKLYPDDLIVADRKKKILPILNEFHGLVGRNSAIRNS